jgi:hypothetical protein
MRYRKPFTPQQRRNAASVYRSLRTTLDTLRKHYRPATALQRDIAQALRGALHEFADVLQAENDRIDVARLNRIRERADQLALDYSWLCLGRRSDA